MKRIISTVATVATLSLIVGCGNSRVQEQNAIDLSQSQSETVALELSKGGAEAPLPSDKESIIVEDGGALPDNEIIKEAIKVDVIEEKVEDKPLENAPSIYNEVVEDDSLSDNKNVAKVEESSSNGGAKAPLPSDKNIAQVEDSSNNETTEDDSSNPVATAKIYKVQGSITDGPVYWADVKIVDPDTKEVLATTKSDENGDYNLSVENLPEIYRTVVTGGKDSGVDALRDDNDEAVPFTMSALIKRNSDGAIVEDGIMPVETANVSPTTTLVDTIVEDGQMPLEEAEELVANSFEVKEDKPFSQMDNKKHLLSNKLSNLIAFLAKLTPVEDKNIAMRAMAKLVIKKEIKITVSDKYPLDLSDFNLTSLLNETNIVAPDSVSPEDIAKFDFSQNAIKPMLSDMLDNLDVASDIRNVTRFSLLSQRMALFELTKEIKSLTYSELDVNMLKTFGENTQTTLKGLLSGIDDINQLNDDSIDFVSGLVRANLGEDIQLLKPKIIKATTQYRIVIKKTTKIKVKKMIKYIYRNSSVDSFENIFTSLQEDSVIDELSKLTDDIQSQTITETGEIKDELDNELIDLSAVEIANEIQKTKTIKTEKIISIKKESINNKLLVESIKSKVKIKIKIKIKSKTKRLSKVDNIQVISSRSVIKNIKTSVKYKVFTKTTQESSETLYNESMRNLADNIAQLQNRIMALQYLIFNLNNIFNVNEFQTTITKTVKVVKTIKENTSIDVVKSLYSVKTKIKEKYTTTAKIAEVVTEIQNNMTNYQKPKVHNKIPIKLLHPTLPSMPDEFKGDIKIKI